MHLVASVHPSVRLFQCLSVCTLLFEPFDLRRQVWSKEESLPIPGVCLCVCNQWAHGRNCADAVDQLLILPTNIIQFVKILIKFSFFLPGVN